MRAHAERRSAEIARPPCLASQPEIVDTFAKVRRILRQGFVGRFFLSADRVTKVDALGKHLWQGMWRAVTHSPDSWPRVASGGWMSRRRRGGGAAGERKARV